MLPEAKVLPFGKDLGWAPPSSSATAAWRILIAVGKTIFGHQEKGAAIEIKVKEVGCFHKAFQRLPGPCLDPRSCQPKIRLLKSA
jgi:hypothetical protein